MKEELKAVMKEESKYLKDLLNLLDKQHEYILKNEIFPLEAIIEDIKVCNKSIAESEVKRRSITKGNTMSDIVKQLNDEEVETIYRDIQKLLHELNLQKDTNELLLKQGLSFSGKILNIINPNRGSTTYNSIGKIER
ncbi:flagellar protein FlgN [Clostridium sp. MSJ-4]|uniref:Flagellar protein FlgN n=1 Tax=Clostridium simiarum TaxID=2841506 RepID=A0ABS6EY07_9CLOT|nr:flagellar protein FlgN [Clostridium simiarum]MBU5591111.1 flagellar protein FlgN [Clostridium simiarum]